jgi:hypothetical protein
MTRTPAIKSSRLQGLWVLLFAAAQLLQGCDNPACVFGPAGCQEDDGGAGGGDVGSELLADPPQDGELLSPDAPEITAFFPRNDAHPLTPIVLIFSESMAPAGIETAFELVQTSVEIGIPDLPGVPLIGTLVGEGRVAILKIDSPIPGAEALPNGTTYRVELSEGAKLLDRTGQALDLGFLNSVGTFSVAETPSATPELLTMWPQHGTTDQSTMPEIVAVFDRTMNPLSVLNPDAFSVTVNESPPTYDPSPSMLVVDTGITFHYFPQVYTWRSFDPDGEPALLGQDSIVALELAESIVSAQNESYPGSSTSFGTASVNPPATVAITSTPTNAFGMSHINGMIPIEVTVTLQDPAAAGDFLTFYIYGNSEDSGSLSLLSREVAVVDGATEVLLGEPLLDIVDDSFGPRFADGNIYIAASQRRGDVRSPVRMLDTDPLESGDQPAILDTVAPILIGLGADGSQTTEYVSTTSGVTVVGLANEELSAVEVMVLLDGVEITNGELAPVVGANSEGGFVAKPITLDPGIVDPLTLPGAMTVTVYDHAMNPAVPLDLDWRQLGVSGPGAALPGGGDVTVRVFDATNHQPVSGALVISHEVDAAVTDLNEGWTDSAGVTLVLSAPVGATVVTVDAAGYDLFTFHGVPTTRLDVPLQPSTPRPGHIFYIARSDVSLLANPLVEVRVADDRLIGAPVPLSCEDSPEVGVLCDFPIADIAASRFGTPTLLATVNSGPFTPESFLKVAQLDFLTQAAEPDGKVILNFEVPELLPELIVDPEEAAQPAPDAFLNTSLLNTLDTSNLVDGSPRVLIEGAVPSLGTTAVVGAGIANDSRPSDGIWEVQGAFAGAADGVSDGAEDQLGRWVSEGLIEDDLLMRIDLEDTQGNATGRRVRFSELGDDPLTAPHAPDVPVLLSPAVNTGGSDFPVEFLDTLDDTQGGLFRVRLSDVTGRSWEVWCLNGAGSGASITANLPEIVTRGGQPLADGPLDVVVSLLGVPRTEFDPAEFMWGELSANADARAHTAVLGLQQP